MVMNNFKKRNCMQLVGSFACVQGVLIFFVLGWGWGEVFFSFSIIPNVFSSSSQWVPHGLTLFFNTIPITLPFQNKSYMLWQMLSSSHVHRCAKVGKHHPSTLESVACV
jgi:hypothetical protein